MKINKFIVFGSLIVGTMCVSAIFAPAISKYDPAGVNLENALMPPSPAPRTPSGLSVEGTASSEMTSTFGNSVAVGSR